MISLSELIKYREYLNELEGTDLIYPQIEVEIPPETIITERWYNGSTERFHQYTLKLEDIPRVNRRLYDKIRYQKQRNDKAKSETS